MRMVASFLADPEGWGAGLPHTGDQCPRCSEAGGSSWSDRPQRWDGSGWHYGARPPVSGMASLHALPPPSPKMGPAQHMHCISVLTPGPPDLLVQGVVSLPVLQVPSATSATVPCVYHMDLPEQEMGLCYSCECQVHTSCLPWALMMSILLCKSLRSCMSVQCQAQRQ